MFFISYDKLETCVTVIAKTMAPSYNTSRGRRKLLDFLCWLVKDVENNAFCFERPIRLH